MQSAVVKILKLILTVVIGVTPIVVAQTQEPAKLNLDKIDKLESKASEVVEVNVEGKMLELAKRVLKKQSDPDAQKVSLAIDKLRAVYVRVYEFENGAKYDMADVDEVRNQLKAPGWEKMVNVRSKVDGEKIDVYSMFAGNDISGVAVIVADADSVVVVNVIGPIDIDTLADLSGKLYIPKLGIDAGDDDKDKEKEKEKEKDKPKKP